MTTLTYIHAHDLGSGRGESDSVIPRGHGIKQCPVVLDGTLLTSRDIANCPRVGLNGGVCNTISHLRQESRWRPEVGETKG